MVYFKNIVLQPTVRIELNSRNKTRVHCDIKDITIPRLNHYIQCY